VHQGAPSPLLDLYNALLDDIGAGQRSHLLDQLVKIAGSYPTKEMPHQLADRVLAAVSPMRRPRIRLGLVVTARLPNGTTAPSHA
jgi:hypothetical protein